MSNYRPEKRERQVKGVFLAKIEGFLLQKLVLGILLAEPEFEGRLMLELENEFGDIDYVSEWLDFSCTHYYDQEMGAPIVKRFISFTKLIDPQQLAAIKIKTNRIEENFRTKDFRRVNLDPGILSQSRFILATTKDGSHRIPLRDGIYGEVTLQYSQKDFRDQPWTYPDYRTSDYKLIFNKIREILSEQIKNQQN